MSDSRCWHEEISSGLILRQSERKQRHLLRRCFRQRRGKQLLVVSLRILNRGNRAEETVLLMVSPGGEEEPRCRPCACIVSKCQPPQTINLDWRIGSIEE